MINFFKFQKFGNLIGMRNKTLSFDGLKVNQKLATQFTRFFGSKSDFHLPHEKHQNKFVKISNTDVKKFPTEEENIDNLLNEMKGELTAKASGNEINFIQKGSILFLGGDSEFLKNIKLGNFISITDSRGKIIAAQCIALRQSLLTFFMLSQEKLTSPLGEIKVINGENIQTEKLMGKIVDIKDSNLSSIWSSTRVTPSLTKLRKRRRLVDDTIFTGNLLIDYISPIFKGNFNILSGGPNLGQKQVLNLIALNFLDKNKSGKNKHIVVYITHSKKEALKISQLLALQNEKNKLKNDNFVVFTLSDKPSDTEFYYLPRIALNFINNHVKDSNVEILLLHDDITNYILQEKNLFQNAKCNISSTNILAEIREQCGNFPENYSLTSVLISEKNKINEEFEEDYIKTINNLYSYTDKIVNFEPNLKLLKRYLPNIQLDFSGLPNIKTQTGYILSHLIEFKEILQLISQSHSKQEEIKKLNIQSDPWDNYLYYDSKFFFDFVFYKNLKHLNYVKPHDNTTANSSQSLIPLEDPEMNFILFKFLTFLFHNDLLANFKIDGKTVALKLISFLEKVEKDDESEFVRTFLKKVLYDKIEPSSEEIDKFEARLEIYFDLYIQELSSKREFSQVKEDYFKV